MLLGNGKREPSIEERIEKKAKKAIQEYGKKGWLRVGKCAKEASKINGKEDPNERTRFYRWRRQVEKGKNKHFQIVKPAFNVSYIGFRTARREDIQRFIEEDKKVKRSLKASLGVLEFLDHIAERKRLEEDRKREEEKAKTEEINTKIKEFEEEFDREET